MIVVDSSALVEALTASDRGAAALDTMQERTAIAPDLLDAEVLHALKGLERGGLVQPDAVELAVSALTTVSIERIATRVLAAGAWALRHDLSIYDAFYVAVAVQRRTHLLTGDRGMAEVALRIGVTVTLV